MKALVDELKCRAMSLIDWATGHDEHFLIFDDNRNLYRKGRKIRAHRVRGHGFREEDGWMHVMTTPDGVKRYIKKGKEG